MLSSLPADAPTCSIVTPDPRVAPAAGAAEPAALDEEDEVDRGGGFLSSALLDPPLDPPPAAGPEAEPVAEPAAVIVTPDMARVELVSASTRSLLVGGSSAEAAVVLVVVEGKGVTWRLLVPPDLLLLPPLSLLSKLSKSASLEGGCGWW